MGLALLCAGCANEEQAPREQAPREQAPHVREVAVPAGPGSRTPHLYVGPAGRLYLSWQEEVDTSRTALRFAVREDERWSAPRTVASGAGWFVNWADFPSVVALADGRTLAAHVLVRSGAASYAYDVHLFRSADGGATGQGPHVPHRDGTPTEHGFVSLVPANAQGEAARDGATLGAVWLDGRQFAEGREEMTLRYATLGPRGTLTDTAVLDVRTCECCQTAAARTPNGFLVAYRDRSPEEVRDIAVVRRVDGQWTAPQVVHHDGWQIAGCPVNGPALAGRGARVALAWFTMAGDQPRVRVAFSDDEGATFGAPVRVDEGRPLGRVDVALLEGGAALVSWMEQREDGAVLHVRRVAAAGEAGPAHVVAATEASRASGFPQMAVRGDSAYFAWTEPAAPDGAPSRIRTAAAALSGFQ